MALRAKTRSSKGYKRKLQKESLARAKRCPRPTSKPTLKQAKTAKTEMEQYHLQYQHRKKRFKAKEAGALGSLGSGSTEPEEETQVMTVLQNYFWQNKDKVLDKLLAFVYDIWPESHENYHIHEKKPCSMDWHFRCLHIK
uniref:Uncharacterized protein n=1 Tax=Catagonus wagneri TaxID=51154 RepID=A0A8C3WHM2_9CETA